MPTKEHCAQLANSCCMSGPWLHSRINHIHSWQGQQDPTKVSSTAQPAPVWRSIHSLEQWLFDLTLWRQQNLYCSYGTGISGDGGASIAAANSCQYDHVMCGNPLRNITSKQLLHCIHTCRYNDNMMKWSVISENRLHQQQKIRIYSHSRQHNPMD